MVLLWLLVSLLFHSCRLCLVATPGMLAGEQDGCESEGMLIGMNHDGHALLTLAEAATYLRVHPRTMTRLLRERQVPGVRIGRQWRIRKTDLDAYFSAGTRDYPARPSDSPPNDDTSAG